MTKTTYQPNKITALYIRNPNDKKKWIVDEQAAEVVRRIFALCVAGKGPMQIARTLAEDKVLTVTAYRAKTANRPLPNLTS